MNIYVGNLAYSLTNDDLHQAFAHFGTVNNASIIFDQETGRSKGFGFVEMPDNTAANNAINELNGAELGDRPLRVNEAKPRRPRSNGLRRY